MEIKNQNILFFTRTMALGGTENVILQLCEIFKPIANKIVVCSCGGVNVSILKKNGIKHYTIDDIERKSVKTILSVCKTIKKIVKEENITVIHTHHRMAAFYISILHLYKKCSFVNTCHNTFYDKKALTRYCYKHAHIIACGQNVKENLVDVYKFQEDKVTAICNAVKPFDSEIVPDKMISRLKEQGYFLVGNIGRLSEQKGMTYFIDSLPLVKRENNKIKYVIVGEGEDKDKLLNQAESLSVKDDVIFLGYRSDIQNLMSQLDVIVLSSLWEGLPLTPIEAFSVKKTVVGTNVGGTTEVIEDYKNGLVVEAKDSKAIASAIICLMNDNCFLNELSNNAYKAYLEKFSFEVFSSNYIRYYKDLKEERTY